MKITREASERSHGLRTLLDATPEAIETKVTDEGIELIVKFVPQFGTMTMHNYYVVLSPQDLTQLFGDLVASAMNEADPLE